MADWKVTGVDQFDGVVARALGTGKAVVVYCYGNWKEGTTDSWCGDCVDADPIIREQCKELDTVLVEIPVGDRDSYKGRPDNVWRQFEKTKLVSIPTLISWGIGGEKGRLVERDCVSKENVTKLINEN